MEESNNQQHLRRLVQDSRHLANMLTNSSGIINTGKSNSILTSANDTLALPLLQRGLEQIQVLSCRLAEKTGALHAAPSFNGDSKA